MTSKELERAIAVEAALQELIGAKDDVAAARAAVREAVTARVGKTVPDDIRIDPVEEDGVRGEWVDSPLDSERRVAIFHHAGAWAFGSPDESRELAARIARASQASVFSLDYRLAPEHPFPAALDDALAAYRSLLEDGADPREIALVGESTGATLALCAAIALRDAGDPLPGALALMSPVTDLTQRADPGASDPVNAWATIERCLAGYLGDVPRDDPRVSPIFADPTGLPAMLVQAGTADPVLGQVRRFVDAATAAGVDVTFREWDGAIHRWQSYPHVYDAGRATNQVGDYVLQRIGPGYVPVPRAA